MSRKIYLLHESNGLLPIEEAGYASEDLLQTLLQNYPDLLAGDQMDETNPRRWLLVDREYGVPDEENGANRWSLDHLFLDQDGIPTLVEVKRNTDSRIRREVVGQMLDYAANAVVYWPIERIRSKFETLTNEQGRNPDEEVLGFIEDGLEDNVDAFWGKVKTNLQAGRIRLVFVADEIPSELRRIVEFLNEQMDPAEVLAVEIKQFAGEGVKTLVPRVIGQTAEAQQKKSAGVRKSRQWDEATFFAELEAKCEPADVEVAKRLYEWGREHLPVSWWGEGATMGSCLMGIGKDGVNYYPVGLWTYGKIELLFQYLSYKPLFRNEGKRLELLQKLNEVPGISLSEDKIGKRPSIDYAVLRNEPAFLAFIGVLQWFVKEMSTA